MQMTLVIADNYSLVANEADRRRLCRLVQPGLEVEANISTEISRSLPQHRRYFAKLNEFAENIPESVARLFWVSVIKDLMMIEQIDADIVHELLKKIIGVNSIAFHRMTQREAARYFERADELLERWASLMEANAP